LARVEESLDAVTSDSWIQRELLAEVRKAREQLAMQPGPALLQGGLEAHVRTLSRRCAAIIEGVQAAFFRIRQPAPPTSSSGPGGKLQGQIQQ
jgi:hypothetical protein